MLTYGSQAGRLPIGGRCPMKLRSHLAVLVVVALLPVLAFGFAMLVVLGRDGQAELHESLVTTARALSLAVDRELEALIRVLEPELHRRDRAEGYRDRGEAV